MPRFHSLLAAAALLAGARVTAACDKCGMDTTGAPHDAAAVTLVTPSPATPAASAFVISLAGEYGRYESRSGEEADRLNQAGRDSHARIDDLGGALTLSLGVSERLALSVTLPYESHRLYESEDPGRIGERERAAGWGDAAFALKYRFREGERWQAAVFAGVKFATGEDDRLKPGGERFESELQPGSGATDFRLGVTAARALGARDRLTLAVSVLERGTGADDTRPGSQLRIDGAWTRSLRPESPRPLALLLEASAFTTGRDRRAGMADADSGTKFALFLAPGVHTRLGNSAAVWLSLPVALVDRENGVHQKRRFEVLTGISFRF